MSAAMKRPRTVSAPPSQEAGGFTMTEIGRRLHVLADQHNEWDIRSLGLSDGSPERQQAEAAMSLLLDERFALQNVVLSMEPKTLQDAAVQAGALFLLIHHLHANCDPEDGVELVKGVKTAERALACLASTVCRLTEVDPADAGDACLSWLFALHSPSHVGVEVSE
jgi:hypothetical protein